MAHTVGKYGIGTLGSLLGLVATNYLTSIFFVACVLGLVSLLAGFNIFRFLFYLKHERPGRRTSHLFHIHTVFHLCIIASYNRCKEFFNHL